MKIKVSIHEPNTEHSYDQKATNLSWLNLFRGYPKIKHMKYFQWYYFTILYPNMVIYETNNYIDLYIHVPYIINYHIVKQIRDLPLCCYNIVTYHQ